MLDGGLAVFATDAGVLVAAEGDLDRLSSHVERLVNDGSLLAMGKAAAGRGRPDAAAVIARAMWEQVRGA